MLKIFFVNVNTVQLDQKR